MATRIIFLIWLLGTGVSAVAQQAADYVFNNGRVYTVDPSAPWAQAVAVKGNSIVFVGSDKEAQEFIGPQTRVGDLAGRMLMPGLVETHLHVMLGAVATSGVWLAGITSVDEVQAKIREYAAAHPNLEVIFGWGYGNVLFGPQGPSKELLDAAVSDRPAFIVREDGHSAWANSKALKAAGINRDTPDPSPPAGVFGRDAEGNPTGAINGGPANLWTAKRLPGLINDEGLRAAAEPLFEHISELGITSLFDAGAPIATEASFDFLVNYDEADGLPVRYTASHYINDAGDAAGAIAELKRLSGTYESPKFRITTLKITTDGVVENRKAAMLSPYADVDSNGALNFEPQVINDLAVDAARNGYSVYMHTLGDRAVRAGLDAAESVRKAGFPETIVTLSHCQLVDADDFPRFAKANVFINSTGGWMQPYDGEEVVLGERADQTFPYRDMLDDGVIFVNSSDFPATPIIDPFSHLEISITRRALGAPMSAKAKNPDSALTVEQGIAAYTINGARMLELDEDIGTITVGKRADLIVLDRNIAEISHNKIHETQVMMTMMDGKMQHDFLFDWGDSVDAPDVEFATGFGGIHQH